MAKPDYFHIGTPVLYTHRACGVVWCPNEYEQGIFGQGELLDEEHWAWSRRDKRFKPQGHHEPPRPSRLSGGKAKPLDRWVYVWPELGSGYVVGLTFRSEGWRNGGTYYGGEGQEYEQPYLSESGRFPLYEVRRDLRTRSVLVPVSATCFDKGGMDWMTYESRLRRAE